MSITAERRASKTREPESRPVKFLFDDEFGDGRARGPRARVSAAEHAAAMLEPHPIDPLRQVLADP